MSRHRSLSTDISTDTQVAELAEHGPLALLLYTWAIPHADDWGRMTGDSRQFKLLVCPGLNVTARDVEAALSVIAETGLWLRYEVGGQSFNQFDKQRWWREQNNWPREEWERLRPTLAPQVFARCGNQCSYCGAVDIPLECDHVIPLSRGGTNTVENLVPACRSCNASKQDKMVEEWRQ